MGAEWKKRKAEADGERHRELSAWFEGEREPEKRRTGHPFWWLMVTVWATLSTVGMEQFL